MQYLALDAQRHQLELDKLIVLGKIRADVLGNFSDGQLKAMLGVAETRMVKDIFEGKAKLSPKRLRESVARQNPGQLDSLNQYLDEMDVIDVKLRALFPTAEGKTARACGTELQAFLKELGVDEDSLVEIMGCTEETLKSYFAGSSFPRYPERMRNAVQAQSENNPQSMRKFDELLEGLRARVGDEVGTQRRERKNAQREAYWARIRAERDNPNSPSAGAGGTSPSAG